MKKAVWAALLAGVLLFATACGTATVEQETEEQPVIETLSPETATAVTTTEAATEDPNKTPFENHGKLSVSGTQIVDESGAAFALHGVSTHGIAWFPQFVNEEAFQTLRDEWGVNCVRIAMYTAENGGYCTGGNQEDLKALVKSGVDYATDLGMYVIIDWHVLNDNDPNVYKEEAKAFFQEMSTTYKDYDNVLYEICNEPNGASWNAVKKYAEEVIPIIKNNNSDALIIVGTPCWCQDVADAASDPIEGYSNLLYSIHFYSATHGANLRREMEKALEKGLPLFCSEFGISDASGGGSCDEESGDDWIEAMDEAGMSYCIWALSNKNETCALIRSDCDKTFGWTYDELTEEGQWYVDTLAGSRE